MNGNFVGSIYGRSFITIAHFGSFRLKTWPPQEILVSDRVSSKKSSPLKPLGQMNRNLVGSIFGVPIKIAHFGRIHQQTQPPQAILVSDWLISKKSSLKLSSQMNSNLVGSASGRFSIKFPQNRMKGERHSEPTEPLVKQLLTCK